MIKCIVRCLSDATAPLISSPRHRSGSSDLSTQSGPPRAINRFKKLAYNALHQKEAKTSSKSDHNMKRIANDYYHDSCTLLPKQKCRGLVSMVIVGKNVSMKTNDWSVKLIRSCIHNLTTVYAFDQCISFYK